jgi:hypothetical protein
MAPALHGPDEPRPPAPERVPTLTEVVELGTVEAPVAAQPDLSDDGGWADATSPLDDHVRDAPADDAEAMMATVPLPPGALPTLTLDVPAPPPPQAPPSREALVQAVLAELEPRIETLLEARLREALAPALARAADGLIREARDETGQALRALVHEAVSHVLARQEPPR